MPGQNKKEVSVFRAQREQTSPLGNKYRNIGPVKLPSGQRWLAFRLNPNILAAAPVRRIDREMLARFALGAQFLAEVGITGRVARPTHGASPWSFQIR